MAGRAGEPRTAAIRADGRAQLRKPRRVAIVGQKGGLTRQEAVDDAPPWSQGEAGGVRATDPEIELGTVAASAWGSREAEQGLVRGTRDRPVGQKPVASMNQQVAVRRDGFYEQPRGAARLDVAFGGEALVGRHNGVAGDRDAFG